MVIMFAVTLAVSILFSSTMTLSVIYINDTIERTLSGLTVHQTLVLVSDQKSESIVDKINSIKDTLDNTGLVEDYGPFIYVEKWVLNKPLNITLENNVNLTITIPDQTIILFTSITDLQAKTRFNPVILLSHELLSDVSRRYGQENWPIYYEMIKNCSAFKTELLDKTFNIGLVSSKCLPDVIDQEISSRLGYPLYALIDKVLPREPSYIGKYMVVIADPDTIDYLISKSSDLGIEVSSGIGNNFLLDQLGRYALSSEERDYMIFSSRYYMSSGFIAVLVPIRYDASRLVYGYSIQASLRNIGNTMYDLSRMFHDKGYGLLVANDRLIEAISSASFMEPFIKFISIITIIPGIIVIWILASRTPSVVLSIIRKIIALIRIRGISLRRIKYSFLIALVIWGLAGLLIGLFLGSTYAILLKNKPLELIPTYMKTSMDIYSIAILLVLTVIALLLSIKKSFSILRDIAPREFTKPTIFAELPLLEKGMGAGSWIVLLFGIYYIVKTAIDFNPILILTQSPPREAILSIILVILAILEPFITFLGPIFFIYGVTKLLISYPDKLSKIIQSLVSPLVGELKSLVSNLIQVKPARLSLSIMMIGFAVGFLLMGLLGIGITGNAFNTIRDVACGTDYYIYKSFNTPSSFLENYALLENNVSKLVNGDYTVLVIIDVGGKEFYLDSENYIKLNYIVFIDKDGFLEIFRVPPGLSEDHNAHDLIREINSRNSILVANPDYKVDVGGSYKIMYMAEQGMPEEIMEVNIIGRFYSLPGWASYDQLAKGPVEILHEPISFMHIPSVEAEPSLVFSKDVLLDFVEELNETMESTAQEFGSHQGSIAEEYSRSPITIYYVIATNNPVDEAIIEDMGWLLYDSTRMKSNIDNSKEVFLVGINHEVTSGLALYSTSMIAIAILTYSSIYENLYAFTLLRARGIKEKEVFKIAISESIVISLLGIIPGLIMGILLGYYSPRAMFITATNPVLRNVFISYGVDLALSFTPEIILPIIVVPGLIILLSLIISILTYRRILREAIMVLGSHI